MGVNLILAAGDSERWEGKTPKQLARVDEEAIISRTVRQLGGNVVIVSHNQAIIEEVRGKAYTIFKPSKRRWITETLLSTCHFWKGQVRVFLGDVIYSDETIKAILENRKRIAVFGKRWEIFGLSFSSRIQEKVIKALKCAIDGNQESGRRKLWEFYRYFAGLSPDDTESLEGKIFQHVTDWTDDIDTIEEYYFFLRKNRYPPPSMSELLRCL